QLAIFNGEGSEKTGENDLLEVLKKRKHQFSTLPRRTPVVVMNFQLTEEHEMMRKMVREFAEKEVAPSAAERDEKEIFDRSIFDKMAELGMTGIPWPEEVGGVGADYLSYVIAVEELSRVCASTGVTLSAHISLASWPLFRFGTPEQKEKFLRPLR